MKRIFFTFIFILGLTSCKKESYNNHHEGVTISERVQMKEQNGFLELKSGKFTYKIPSEKLPFKRVVLLNSSLVGYFTELNLEQNIVGVSSPEYIYSETILKLMGQNKIQNIGNEQKYDVEKIIALKPDAIFTNYIASFENTYDLLKKNGIELIFLDEYLEQKPLDKSRYLLLFGKLFGVETKANERFSEIKTRYDSLISVAKHLTPQPIVLTNEMYGNQWFLSGGKTFTAAYIADASGRYILKDNLEEKAVPMSFEEVYAKAKEATIWVNAGNYQSKKEMLMMQPHYAQLKVFQQGKIFTTNARQLGMANDFFESGAVRADLVLKDYIKVLHPQWLPNDTLRYMKELK